MTVITELANGNIEVFHSENYTISRVKDFHPLIVSVKVYDSGRLIKKRSRRFPLWYKLVTYKSAKVQELLRKINEQQCAAHWNAEDVTSATVSIVDETLGTVQTETITHETETPEES